MLEGGLAGVRLEGLGQGFRSVRRWLEAVGGWERGADEVLVARAYVEDCASAGGEEPSVGGIYINYLFSPLGTRSSSRLTHDQKKKHCE